MIVKYFLLYANGNIRELTREQYQKIYEKPSCTIRLIENDMFIHKGENFVWFRKGQLLEVLEKAGWTKTEAKSS